MEIKNDAQLRELYKRLVAADVVAFDFETTGLHHKLMDLVAVSFMDNVSGEPSYIDYKTFDRFTMSKFMKGVFDSDSLKVGHNLQFDLKVAKHFYGITASKKFDTMLASWYLDENRPKGLKYLGPNLLKINMTDSWKTVKDKSHESFVKYSELDSLATYQLYELFAPQLKAEGLDKLFNKLEMPFIDVLIDMTLAGIHVDLKFLKDMESYLVLKKEELSKQIFSKFGSFNINSSQQLCEILYGFTYHRKGGEVIFDNMTPEKKAAVVDWTRPKDGLGTPVPSTDVNALAALAKKRKSLLPFLEYSEVEKALVTYASGYQKFVVNGMIYPLFNQAGTVTGRLSSNDPNMQNIPADTKAKYFVKDAFYAPDGCDLIVADESQLELRVLAHYSQAPMLLEAFRTGLDIHTKTSTGLFHKEYEEVTKDERRIGKTYNFATVYGQTVPALAKKLGISKSTAQEYHDSFFELYKGVKTYMYMVEIEMMRNGYIETIIGRKRRVPDILSPITGIHNHAVRQTINSQIQGSASDILKLAMLKIHKEFKDQNLDAQMLLQIHDELVVRSNNKAHSKQAAEIVKHYMEHPFARDLSVPLETNPIICRTWGDGKRDG